MNVITLSSSIKNKNLIVKYKESISSFKRVGFVSQLISAVTQIAPLQVIVYAVCPHSIASYVAATLVSIFLIEYNFRSFIQSTTRGFIDRDYSKFSTGVLFYASFIITIALAAGSLVLSQNGSYYTVYDQKTSALLDYDKSYETAIDATFESKKAAILSEKANYLDNYKKSIQKWDKSWNNINSKPNSYLDANGQSKSEVLKWILNQKNNVISSKKSKLQDYERQISALPSQIAEAKNIEKNKAIAERNEKQRRVDAQLLSKNEKNAFFANAFSILALISVPLSLFCLTIVAIFEHSSITKEQKIRNRPVLFSLIVRKFDTWFYNRIVKLFGIELPQKTSNDSTKPEKATIVTKEKSNDIPSAEGDEKPKLYNRECLHCQTKFQTTNKKKKYCKNTCRTKYNYHKPGVVELEIA